MALAQSNLLEQLHHKPMMVETMMVRDEVMAATTKRAPRMMMEDNLHKRIPIGLDRALSRSWLALDRDGSKETKDIIFSAFLPSPLLSFVPPQFLSIPPVSLSVRRIQRLDW